VPKRSQPSHAVATRLALVSIFAVLIGLLTAALALAGHAGSFDRTFGGDGTVVLGKVPGGVASADIGRRGRIVVAGPTNNNDFTVARLRSGGVLDHSFSSDGVATARFGSDLARATWVAISRGGVVVGGNVCPQSGSGDCGFGVARFLSNGSVDRSFGDAGRGKVRLPNGVGPFPAVAIDGRGRIVVAVNRCGQFGGGCEFALVRLRRGGILDRSFGHDGTVVSSFAQPGEHCPLSRGLGSVRAMAIDSRDRIVVGGSCRHGVAVARFKSDGQIDRSFGTNGRIDKDVGTNDLRALAIDSTNRIDASGSLGRRFAVARFDAQGHWDHHFGSRGTGEIRFPGVPVLNTSITLDHQGRIVLGGGRAVTGGTETDIGRLGPNGHVDRHFGHRGRVEIDRDGLDFSPVAIDQRNRIIGGGSGGQPDSAHFALVRLLG
jgi:uncharacterized delta-60 repeat protein